MFKVNGAFLKSHLRISTITSLSLFPFEILITRQAGHEVYSGIFTAVGFEPALSQTPLVPSASPYTGLLKADSLNQKRPTLSMGRHQPEQQRHRSSQGHTCTSYVHGVQEAPKPARDSPRRAGVTGVWVREAGMPIKWTSFIFP